MDVQPDESGELRVAEGTGGRPEQVAVPLPRDAGLEILDDGAYWIGPGDAQKEKIGHLPAGTRLVYLVPEGELQLPDVGPLSAESIPAVGDGLDADAAERFLRALRHHKTGDGAAVVVLPGAWGAAFFKGAYLMAARGLGLDAAVVELEPDLEKAGEHREEILHRLSRLDVGALQAILKP